MIISAYGSTASIAATNEHIACRDVLRLKNREDALDRLEEAHREQARLWRSQSATFQHDLPKGQMSMFGIDEPQDDGKPVRVSLSASKRFDVLARSGFKCVYCGRGQADGVKLHVDHVVPVAGGGGNDLSNLVGACDKCNLGKGARHLVLVKS